MSFDSFGTSGGSAGGGGGEGNIDPKLVQMAYQMQMQAEIMQRMAKVSEMCWDTCDINPKDHLDGKQETCLRFCAERYIDSANYIRNRLAQKGANKGLS
ncbi:hypothetical protein DPMN_112275 [Dreissena polymorpha]|uniref:Mitochondrial import inner membrane translocase subunit n=1 Tax=Dreissena polymorpha TaxID=45954 RepID=A0A9D4QPS0_DREPO|nr:hypothetical protein DPMN_112275 [Dreissena polymorpha]